VLCVLVIIDQFSGDVYCIRQPGKFRTGIWILLSYHVGKLLSILETRAGIRVIIQAEQVSAAGIVLLTGFAP
jgi:hypothetical protein